MTAIHLTTDQGKPLVENNPEPNPGSVVLTHGQFGTAWQRHFADGLWHRLGGGRPRSWDYMLTQRQVVLVYEAPVRTQSETGVKV